MYNNSINKKRTYQLKAKGSCIYKNTIYTEKH